MKVKLLKVLPPIWFLMFLLLGLLAHYAYPMSRVFDVSIPIFGLAVGAVIFVAGFALSNWASMLFSHERTEILPTSPVNSVLVVSGPFRFTRNPMYLGMLLSLFGVAIYIGTLPSYVAVLAHFLILNFVFIPYEEEKMERQFGEAYREYSRGVRRWL